jgi:hypothetical protein
MRKHVLYSITGIALCACLFGCHSGETTPAGGAGAPAAGMQKGNGGAAQESSAMTPGRPPGASDVQFGTKVPGKGGQ